MGWLSIYTRPTNGSPFSRGPTCRRRIQTPYFYIPAALGGYSLTSIVQFIDVSKAEANLSLAEVSLISVNMIDAMDKVITFEEISSSVKRIMKPKDLYYFLPFSVEDSVRNRYIHIKDKLARSVWLLVA